MKNSYHSRELARHRRLAARSAVFETPHGSVTTPAFMPVGTRAAVNHMLPEELKTSGTQILLGGNTYHMLCTPGMEVIRANGGMHKFMQWNGPMLTDSGGFQVFSLSKNKKLCRIDEAGAHFKHPNTGERLHLSPETSIQAQKTIGADIIMAFDQCTPETGGREVALAAMERTHRWLGESLETHSKKTHSDYGAHQALFGIIQGGRFQDLREQSTRFIVSCNTDGIAIGGETIGFDMEKTAEIINWVRPLLPPHKIRYTMGVGLNPQDLIDVVAEGIDIFDCVAPTRNARHGALYHGYLIEEGDWLRFHNDGKPPRLLIKKSDYAKDDRPILAGCNCYTCQHYSRGYLHFLFKTKGALYHQLACIHNIYTMHHVCEKLRACIQRHSTSTDQPRENSATNTR